MYVNKAITIDEVKEPILTVFPRQYKPHAGDIICMEETKRMKS